MSVLPKGDLALLQRQQIMVQLVIVQRREHLADGTPDRHTAACTTTAEGIAKTSVAKTQRRSHASCDRRLADQSRGQFAIGTGLLHQCVVQAFFTKQRATERHLLPFVQAQQQGLCQAVCLRCHRQQPS
ncbi:hypothetical protein D3C77_235790 [compost metagenome]